MSQETSRGSWGRWLSVAGVSLGVGAVVGAVTGIVGGIEEDEE